MQITKFLRQHQLKNLYDNISEMAVKIENSSKTISWPAGMESPFKANVRFDVNRWIYFNETHFFLNDEFSTCDRISGIFQSDIENVVQSSQTFLKQMNFEMKFLGGYKRFEPTRGMDYILDVLLTDKHTGEEISERLTATRSLSNIEMIPVPYVTEHSRIVLVLIVNPNNTNEAANFIENYERECLQKHDSSVLVLILLNTDSNEDAVDPFYNIKSLSSNYTAKYHQTNGRIAWMSLAQHLKPNLSIIPILDLLVRKLTPDSLVLLCGINMDVKMEYLNRVRMNTIRGTQVFFPIPFLQYNTEIVYGLKSNQIPDNVELKNGVGHFQLGSYEQSAFYVSDYLTARRVIERNFPSARSPKDLKREIYYDNGPTLKDIFIKSQSVHVMRAPEPDLRHYHMPFKCHNLNYDNCLRKQAESLGPRTMLAGMVIKHKHA